MTNSWKNSGNFLHFYIVNETPFILTRFFQDFSVFDFFQIFSDFQLFWTFSSFPGFFRIFPDFFSIFLDFFDFDISYFFQFFLDFFRIFSITVFLLNEPAGSSFLEGLKSGLYWNEGYIRMRVAVYFFISTFKCFLSDLFPSHTKVFCTFCYYPFC